VYCELLGYSTTHDNKAIKLFNQRNAEPMVRAMMDALKDARVQPDEIDYINCMANSCPGVDEVEAESIRCVFNQEREIPIGTFKGSTGEVFGASDCLGVIQTALTLKERTIAPIANLEAIDPQCALHYVRHSPQDRNVKTALTNSFEVGGNVQAKVVRSFEGFKA
jgi:3-oxoacyl-[acyl-carrier-protein] synthase II